MAKKVKITKGGQTVYPATVMDAVVHKDLRVDSSKLIEEVNVSKIFPTGGIDGTNKYTLETAIAMIPNSLRNVGIKCSFFNEGNQVETWECQGGGAFTAVTSWKQIGAQALKTGILNVNLIAGKFTEFYTLDTAISAIPLKNRNPFAIIAYRTANDRMEYAQYTGSNVDDIFWVDMSRWKVLNAEEKKITADTINVNILTNEFAKIYTLETAITEVPAKNRSPFALVCYRTNSSIEYAQYGISDTQDVYWNDASRWTVLNPAEEEDTEDDTNISEYFDSTDISSSLSVNTQMAPSQTTIGEPTTIDESGNNLINSIKINVVPGDEIVITGTGGSGPRLYYQIGLDTKLLYIANPGSIVENYRLNITQAGVFVLNVRNDKPFTIIKNGVVFCLQEDVRKVNDSIRKVNDSILAGNVLSSISYRIGVAISTKGEEVTGGYPNWATSDFIKSDLPIYLNVSGGYHIRLSYYDAEDDSFIKYEDIRTANITIPANSYFKITAIFSDGIEIESVDDILENIKGYLIEPATETQYRNWYALGDSITDGYISYYDEENNPKSKVDRAQCWATKLAAIRKDLMLTNHGVGGEGYLDPAVGTAKDTVDSIDFSNADIVTLAYGINDWKGNQILGDRATPDTVLGNMAYCIEKIIGDNPACKIYVLLPLNCCGYSFNYGTEEANWALGYDGFSNTGTLESFVSKMKEVADYYGIETIDLTHHSVVNRKSLRSLLIDGVHPSVECHAAIALELAYKI